jgi:restriction system protein
MTTEVFEGRITMAKTLPTFDQLLNPLIKALRALGGSGSIQEIYDKVVEVERLSEQVLSQPHGENGDQTEVAYRLAWARSYLKKFGLLENSKRGVWSLTAQAKDVDKVNPQEVVRAVRALSKKGAKTVEQLAPPETPDELLQEEAQEEAWKLKLNSILTKLEPAAFERLAQRVLRELGFIQVDVTGRSGDGGIDGRGIARINGVMSFHVLFQCKRYKGTVGPGEIRDFRGAMVGRADKGLFITTGVFTPAAVKEATRDGAPPIDLIDGEEFAVQLKELGLGVRKELIETIKIDEKWFEGV